MSVTMASRFPEDMESRVTMQRVPAYTCHPVGCYRMFAVVAVSLEGNHRAGQVTSRYMVAIVSQGARLLDEEPCRGASTPIYLIRQVGGMGCADMGRVIQIQPHCYTVR